MKKAILALIALLLGACAELSPAADAAKAEAEKAAAILACKVEVVRPYFDSADEARRFALDAMAGRIHPAQAYQMLGELGMKPDQIKALIDRFRKCSPQPEPEPAPPAPRVTT